MTLSQNASSLNKRYEELVNHDDEGKQDTLYAESLNKSLCVVLATLRGHFQHMLFIIIIERERNKLNVLVLCT